MAICMWWSASTSWHYFAVTLDIFHFFPLNSFIYLGVIEILLEVSLFFLFTLVFILFLPLFSQGADVTDPGTETEESLGASDSTQRPADSQTPSRKIRETLSNAHMQIHLRVSTCAHELSRFPLTYLTVTEKDVICCCLFEGKGGSQNKVMSATRASCFTLTIKQITHVLFKSQIENIQTLGLVLLADVFFLHKQLQMENNGN